MRKVNVFSKVVMVAFAILLPTVSQSFAQPTKFDPSDPAAPFYEKTRNAPAAFSTGEIDKARRLSSELLTEAKNYKENWNYGNAIHAANIVLGRIAVKEDKIEDAKRYLLLAGETPGSPQLNTFGPDMNLAKELLEKGEKETVLSYFERCAKFWGKDSSKLDGWRAAVERGEIPSFGANLRYLGF